MVPRKRPYFRLHLHCLSYDYGILRVKHQVILRPCTRTHTYTIFNQIFVHSRVIPLWGESLYLLIELFDVA